MAGPQHADGTGDAVLLRLMLRNLLENAARYSPAGTTIEVALTATEGYPGERYRSGAGY